MNIRAAAAQVVYEVIVNGYSLSDTLPQVSTEFHDARDRALLQAICYGVCRWYLKLDAIAKKLLQRPMKQKDLDLYALILVGLYQLSDMRIPHYAAITETVSATKALSKVWAKALVNGVLREYQREEEHIKRDTSLEMLYSHPRWMVEKIETAYPSQWKKILEANNQHPPFSLRINQKQVTREQYLEKLTAADIKAEIIPENNVGIILENPVDVLKLPGFVAGDVSVQDGAAQLAAGLLMLEPNQKVLDACAAPGGKTAHMLESQANIECVAVDNDASRIAVTEENLARLKLTAKCITADVVDVKKWWDGQLFDRILLDAPCSASGVIRRHPDIKLLRRASDIGRLAEMQLRLLNAVWEVLKPGGILLYATCSIFPEENSDVLQKFLAAHADAKEDKIESSWGIDCTVGKQILPGMHSMDGFYFARLRK